MAYLPFCSYFTEANPVSGTSKCKVTWKTQLLPNLSHSSLAVGSPRRFFYHATLVGSWLSMPQDHSIYFYSFICHTHLSQLHYKQVKGKRLDSSLSFKRILLCFLKATILVWPMQITALCFKKLQSELTFNLYFCSIVRTLIYYTLKRLTRSLYKYHRERKRACLLRVFQRISQTIQHSKQRTVLFCWKINLHSHTVLGKI